LSKGDITKKDYILWNHTIEEARPYLKFIEREVLFREAVIAFFVDESKTKEGVKDKFCNTCKQAFPDKDCKTCTKEFDVLEDKEKTIGN
jgi:hypothetical protein